MQFHVGEGVHYGFVQFKKSEHAEAVLSKETHCISTWPLTVGAADDCHQPGFKSENWMLPPQQDSSLHILTALDDDCIREILLRLDIIELTKAADVCVRFNQLAKRVFDVKYKHLKIDGETFEYFIWSFAFLFKKFRITNSFASY